MNQNMAYTGNIQPSSFPPMTSTSPLNAQSINTMNSQSLPQQQIPTNPMQQYSMPNMELIQQVPFRFKLFPNITSRYLQGTNPQTETTIAPQTIPNISRFFTHKTYYDYVAAQNSNYVHQSLGFTNIPFSTSTYKIHNPTESNIIETHFDADQPNNVILHSTVHASPKGNSLVLSTKGSPAKDSLFGSNLIGSSNILSQTMPVNLSNSSQILGSQFSQTSPVNRGGLSEKDFYEQSLNLQGRIISLGNPQVISSQIIPNEQASPKLKASMMLDSQIKDSQASRYTEGHSNVMDEGKLDPYQSQKVPILHSTQGNTYISGNQKLY